MGFQQDLEEGKKNADRLVKKKSAAAANLDSPEHVKEVIVTCRVLGRLLRHAKDYLQQVAGSTSSHCAQAAKLIPIVDQLALLQQAQADALGQGNVGLFHQLVGQEQEVSKTILKKTHTRRKRKLALQVACMSLFVFLGACSTFSAPRTYPTPAVEASHGLKSYETTLPDKYFETLAELARRDPGENQTAIGIAFNVPIGYDWPLSWEDMSARLTEVDPSPQLLEKVRLVYVYQFNIVYRESELNKKSMQSTMAHERMHWQIDQLPYDQLWTLARATRSMQTYVTEHPTECAKKFLLIFPQSDWACVNAILATRDKQWEVYAYMADGSFSDQVVNHMRDHYPEAYAIYLELIRRIN